MNIKVDLPEHFLQEEDRTLRVSFETKRLWAVLLDLLREFDRVCKTYGVRYMIDGGTLLGAKRHGGFIPWDDDIDVIMLRSEYEKLNAVAPTAFKAPYFWQTEETDPGHGRAFARLRNGGTTYVPAFEMRSGKPALKHNQGAFIDVFICDNLPDDQKERHVFLRQLDRLHRRAWSFRYSRIRGWSLWPLMRPQDVVKLIVLGFSRLLGRDLERDAVRRLGRLAQKYNGRDCKFVSHVTFEADERARMCLKVPRRVFDEFEEVEFEGFRFPATKLFDEYLTIVYGNWRKHVISARDKILFDADRSYVQYLGGCVGK